MENCLVTKKSINRLQNYPGSDCGSERCDWPSFLSSLSSVVTSCNQCTRQSSSIFSTIFYYKRYKYINVSFAWRKEFILHVSGMNKVNSCSDIRSTGKFFCFVLFCVFCFFVVVVSLKFHELYQSRSVHKIRLSICN